MSGKRGEAEVCRLQKAAAGTAGAKAPGGAGEWRCEACGLEWREPRVQSTTERTIRPRRALGLFRDSGLDPKSHGWDHGVFSRERHDSTGLEMVTLTAVWKKPGRTTRPEAPADFKVEGGGPPEQSPACFSLCSTAGSLCDRNSVAHKCQAHPFPQFKNMHHSKIKLCRIIWASQLLCTCNVAIPLLPLA